MATLMTAHEFLSKEQLSFSLSLQDTKLTENDEGWIAYQIELKSGEETISRVAGSIHDADIRRLCEVLRQNQQSTFEPTEPDFYITVQPAEDEDETELCIFIDAGAASERGYVTSGIGLRLILRSGKVDAFVNALSQELKAITGGKQYGF